MGRAFTEQERDSVRNTLRREGLKLLKQNGIRNVSIRELTRRAGIAQGGFYTFYKDKDDFMSDLFLLRIREKTQQMLNRKEESLDNPIGYMAELLFREGMHLKENMAFNNRVSGSIDFFLRSEELGSGKGRALYRDFLENLASYWEENGYQVSCDVDGLISAGVMAAVLFSNAELIPDPYFPEIYKAYCESQVNLFLKVNRT